MFGWVLEHAAAIATTNVVQGARASRRGDFMMNLQENVRIGK
jgi:hypothetical protein